MGPKKSEGRVKNKGTGKHGDHIAPVTYGKHQPLSLPAEHDLKPLHLLFVDLRRALNHKGLELPYTFPDCVCLLVSPHTKEYYLNHFKEVLQCIASYPFCHRDHTREEITANEEDGIQPESQTRWSSTTRFPRDVLNQQSQPLPFVRPMYTQTYVKTGDVKSSEAGNMRMVEYQVDDIRRLYLALRASHPFDITHCENKKAIRHLPAISDRHQPSLKIRKLIEAQLPTRDDFFGCSKNNGECNAYAYVLSMFVISLFGGDRPNVDTLPYDRFYDNSVLKSVLGTERWAVGELHMKLATFGRQDHIHAIEKSQWLIVNKWIDDKVINIEDIISLKWEESEGLNEVLVKIELEQ